MVRAGLRGARCFALVAVLCVARTLLQVAPSFVGLRAARPASAVVRRVAEGDMLPSVEVDEGKPGETVNVLELFKGKKGVLFAVPGAFTPTCSERHLPGFIEGAEELKAAGAEVIACVSVNDAFVMSAWGKAQEAEGKVRMLADAKLDLTKALDMELDATAKLGTVRSKRYAMLVEDGKVTKLGMDDDSFAPAMLEALKR
eukprot:CAMPEP_0171095870 /NCGR_PEP_ID=MMETSP0766_2-20121228/43417_1 /TAXON_ID=439317 /ORGANISM="Gambierdiscus australes, Strain CAWD 149" /LENGTH=199 /DNA_ID=CAMNT_0011554735 /DNA_START=68 /DNA_END=667 /DNA_ORIENTATION=+